MPPSGTRSTWWIGAEPAACPASVGPQGSADGARSPESRVRSMSTPWWARLRDAVAGAAPAPRTTGRPPSSNGASSFHLGWVLDGADHVTDVSVTLEVVTPPTVPRLYFWALQTDVGGAAGRAGGAHL